MGDSEVGTVFVTGSSSGIGYATVVKLLDEGYQVVGFDQNPPIDFGGGENFVFHQVDLANSKELLNRMSDVLTTVDGPIKGLVNNAGIGKMGFLEQLSVADIQQVIQTNFLSHVLITKAMIPRLKQQVELADIIFIGSEAALKGARQGTIYCASKFALRGFSQALREECAKANVRVTLINPGAVRTAFFNELNFEPGPLPDNAIEADDVALAVLSALEARPGTVIEEINLSPMTHVWQKKQ